MDVELRNVRQEIELRYEVRFLEIGTDKNHVHFLLQAVPKLSPSQIICIIKSITAKEIRMRCPQVKKQLWGGEFWSDGYYVGTVGKHANEQTVKDYVKEQGREKEYKSLLVQQMTIF